MSNLLTKPELEALRGTGIDGEILLAIAGSAKLLCEVTEECTRSIECVNKANNRGFEEEADHQTNKRSIVQMFELDCLDFARGAAKVARRISNVKQEPNAKRAVERN